MCWTLAGVMSPTNYREQMTCDFKSILSEMCKFNPVWSEKDQAGPCWGGWWGQAELSVHGIGISRAPGPGWDRAGDKLSSSLAQAVAESPGLSWTAASGPWAVGGGPRGGWAGLSWAPRTLREQPSTESRTGMALLGGSLQWGTSPVSRSTLEVTPSCAHPLHRLCCVRSWAESELEETHKIIQSSSVTLVPFDQNLTLAYQMAPPYQANFLTMPCLRTFLRGLGQIWNTLSMPNSLPCAMQRLLWCSAFRFWKLCNKLMFTDYHSLFLSLESGTA